MSGWLSRARSVWTRRLRAGSPKAQGGRIAIRPMLEVLEDRVVPDAVSWTAGASGFWDDAANWLDTTNNQHQVPTAADDVTINQPGVTVTVRDARTVNSLSIPASTATLAVTAGSLDAVASSTVAGGLSISGGTLSIESLLTVSGTITFTGGTITGAGTLANSGTLDASSAGTLTLSSSLTNTGTLEVDSGTLNVAGASFANTGGSLDITGGELLLQATAVSNTNGAITIANGASLEFNGGTYTGTYTATGAGTVLIGSNGVSGSGATFDFPVGMLQWSQGTFFGGSTGLTITNVTISGQVDVFGEYINDGTITQTASGSLQLLDAFDSHHNLIAHGTLINAADGIYDLSSVGDTGGDYSAISGASSSTFDNQGLLRITAGTDEPVIVPTTFSNTGTVQLLAGAVAFNDTTFSNNSGGTLDIEGGQLQLGDSVTTTNQSGVITIAGGASLLLNNGSFTGTYAPSGAGTVLVGSIYAAGATFNFPAGMFQWGGGYIDGGSTGLTNLGSLTIGGSAHLFGLLTNHGTITQTAAGNLQVLDELAAGTVTAPGTLINAADGTYDLSSVGDTGGDYSAISGDTFDNQGLLSITAGMDEPVIVPTTFSNTGTVQLLAGTVEFDAGFTNSGSIDVQAGTLRVPNSNVSFDSSSGLEISPTAELDLGGSLLGTTQNVQAFTPSGTVLLDGSGTSAAPQLLEAMSQDMGNHIAGLTNNFAYGTLELGNDTLVQLVDNARNSPLSGPDAVYVSDLIVPAGCTLDLNGLTLWAGVIDVEGTVTGGSVSQLDVIPPAVSSIRPAAGSPTNTTSVPFTVTLSEAVVGINPADFTVTTTGAISGALVASIVPVSGSVYTVNVNTGSGDGTVGLNVNSSTTIQDLAGNALPGAGFTGVGSYTIDKTPPTVLSSDPIATSPTNVSSVAFTVTFSEDVTHVSAAGFTLTTTGTISGVAVASIVPVSGRVYTVTVNTGSGDGTLRLDVNTTTIQDLAGIRSPVEIRSELGTKGKNGGVISSPNAKGHAGAEHLRKV